MSLDDATLMAFVDGELDPARRSEVEAAVAASPALAARVQRQRRLRGRLQDAFAPVLEEPVPERLLQAVAGEAQVVRLAERRPRALARGAPMWTAMAACLVIGVLAGVRMAALRPSAWVQADAGGLQAGGTLGRALDQQLASTGAAGPVRVGLSFLSTDGRYCRTFTSAEGLAGLACRAPKGWRLQLIQQGTAEAQGGGYRMAGSQTPPQVLQAAQAMMAGAPLDARGEAAARACGWRR